MYYDYGLGMTNIHHGGPEFAYTIHNRTKAISESASKSLGVWSSYEILQLFVERVIFQTNSNVANTDAGHSTQSAYTVIVKVIINIFHQATPNHLPFTKENSTVCVCVCAAGFWKCPSLRM